jgi:predicted metal-binding membrane protein
MADSALAALLRRDRAIVLTALIVVTVLAWTHVLHLAQAMSDMAGMPGLALRPGMPNMPGMDMDAAGMMSAVFGQWSLDHFVTLFAMWTVMMIGMMTPSVAPMILIYAQVARRQTGTRPFASALWFAGGYLLAWTGFSLLATLAQWGLEQLALLSPMMAGTRRSFGGGLLIVAGVYQWLPLKYSCLSRCRAPLSFVMEHGGFQAHATGSLRLGLRHGLYCIGCCWALMALLYVGGVMNLLWIAALMVIVLLEKLLPGWRHFARASGVAAVVLGFWYLLR